MKFSTHKLVYASILIALSIILTRVLSFRMAIGGVEGIRIGFGGLPIVFAGIALGPLAGGIVGAVSDVLGYFINPMGAYMPHFTLTSFLTGFIPGLLIFYFFKSNKRYIYLLTATGIGQVLTAVIMVPFLIEYLFGVPLEVTLVPRIISQAIQIPIYAYFCQVLLGYDLIELPEEIRAV